MEYSNRLDDKWRCTGEITFKVKKMRVLTLGRPHGHSPDRGNAPFIVFIDHQISDVVEQ